jgi:hypothetical protein
VCWKKNKWQYIIMQEKFALEWLGQRT